MNTKSRRSSGKGDLVKVMYRHLRSASSVINPTIDRLRQKLGGDMVPADMKLDKYGRGDRSLCDAGLAPQGYGRLYAMPKKDGGFVLIDNVTLTWDRYPLPLTVSAAEVIYTSAHNSLPEYFDVPLEEFEIDTEDKLAPVVDWIRCSVRRGARLTLVVTCLGIALFAFDESKDRKGEPAYFVMTEGMIVASKRAKQLSLDGSNLGTLEEYLRQRVSMDLKQTAPKHPAG